MCLCSEEVALLLNVCHAAAISDHLPAGTESRHRLQRFLGEVQSGLFDTAQTVWQRRRKACRPPADPAISEVAIEADR